MGLNNVGLLIRASGKVTFLGDGFFYISDGSPLDDGGGIEGVYVAHSYTGSVGDFVAVTGISSCIKKSGKIVRAIRPRGDGDILRIQQNF